MRNNFRNECIATKLVKTLWCPIWYLTPSPPLIFNKRFDLYAAAVQVLLIDIGSFVLFLRFAKSRKSRHGRKVLVSIRRAYTSSPMVQDQASRGVNYAYYHASCVAMLYPHRWCFWPQVKQDTFGPSNYKILGSSWTKHHRCTWNCTEMTITSFPAQGIYTVWIAPCMSW